MMLPPSAILFKRFQPLTPIEQLAYEIEEIESKLVCKKTQLRDLILHKSNRVLVHQLPR